MKCCLKICFVLAVFLFVTGCQTATEQKVETSIPQPTAAKIIAPKNESVKMIDVPKLANQSAAEIEKILGKPTETKNIENEGEYRLYKIAGQTKGLAVRFYGGKAKSFNLILDKPLPTSKEALKQIFNIDVGNISPTKDPKETLSETYQGTFDGVKFTKVSAKKQANGSGFVFVLAETAN